MKPRVADSRILLLGIPLLAAMLLLIFQPEPSSEDPLEGMRSQLPGLFEPLDRLASEQVQRALGEDPEGFVRRQLDQTDPMELSLGLMAMDHVAVRYGPDMLRDFLPRVAELTEHSNPLVSVSSVALLGRFHPLEPTLVVDTLVGLLEDPNPGMRAAAAFHLSYWHEKDAQLATVLLEAATDEVHDHTHAMLLVGAANAGGDRAVEALFSALAETRDESGRGQMLEALGRHAKEDPRAGKALLKEAFSGDAGVQVVAGARMGLFHRLTETGFAELGSEEIERLKADISDYSELTLPSALLLARVARGKQDSRLAEQAADSLAFELELHPQTHEIMVVRELLALGELVELQHDEVLEGIEELLERPYGMSWAHRVELRAIRDSLR